MSSNDHPLFNSNTYLYGEPDISPEHAAIQGMFLSGNFLSRMWFAKRYFAEVTIRTMQYEREFGPYVAPPPDEVHTLGMAPARAAAFRIAYAASELKKDRAIGCFKEGASDGDTDARFETYGFSVLLHDGADAVTVRGSMGGDEHPVVLRQIHSTWHRLLKSHPNREYLASCSNNLWVVIGEYTGQGLPLALVKHMFYKSGVTLLTLADINTNPFLEESKS